jgi:predicted transcriptional regulator
MNEALIELTAGIVASYVENNSIAPNDLPNLIQTVHAALSGAGRAEAPVQETPKATPAQIRKSITPDYLVSFIDGKKYKTLKRHLATHGTTFEEYKASFGLPKDYPTVSPNYSAQRSQMAKALGLGQQGRGNASAAARGRAKGGKAKKTAG